MRDGWLAENDRPARTPSKKRRGLFFSFRCLNFFFARNDHSIFLLPGCCPHGTFQNQSLSPPHLLHAFHLLIVATLTQVELCLFFKSYSAMLDGSDVFASFRREAMPAHR